MLDGSGDPLATGLAEPPTLGLLMQQQLGASLIACPAVFNTTTSPRHWHWHRLMRARAVDTQCFVLACSSARPQGGAGYPSYGHSQVVDPWGAVIAEAESGEEVLHPCWI